MLVAGTTKPNQSRAPAAQFLLQLAPEFFSLGQGLLQRLQFGVQAERFLGVAGAQQLLRELLFLGVEPGDRLFDRRDLVANLPFIPTGSRVGLGRWWASRRPRTRLAPGGGGRPFSLVNPAVDRVEIAVVRPVLGHHPSVAHLDDATRHPLHEMPVVAGENDRPRMGDQRFGQRFHSVDVEVVPRFVENQEFVIPQQEPREAEPGPLTSREDGDRLFDVIPTEQQGPRHRETTDKRGRSSFPV